MSSDIEAQDHNGQSVDRNTMESKSSLINIDEDCENAPGTLVLSRTCSLFSHVNVDDLDDDYDKTIFAGFTVPPKESAVNTSFEGTILIPDRCDIDLQTSHVISIVQLDANKQKSKKRREEIPNKAPRKKSVCEKHSEKWRSMYSLAKAYTEENGGHWNIPRTNHRLGNWIKRQRQQYRKSMAGKPSSMTSRRITELNEIEFEWEPREATWKEKFNALRQFWLENLHTDLPLAREFRNLIRWCNRQRESFWANTMDQKRIVMLDDIDFEWGEAEKYGDVGDEVYDRLALE